MIKKLIIFTILFFSATIASAQSIPTISPWKTSLGNIIQPVSSSATVKIPSLGAPGNPCLSTTEDGTLTTTSCGSNAVGENGTVQLSDGSGNFTSNPLFNFDGTTLNTQGTIFMKNGTDNFASIQPDTTIDPTYPDLRIQTDGNNQAIILQSQPSNPGYGYVEVQNNLTVKPKPTAGFPNNVLGGVTDACATTDIIAYDNGNEPPALYKNLSVGDKIYLNGDTNQYAFVTQKLSQTEVYVDRAIGDCNTGQSIGKISGIASMFDVDGNPKFVINPSGSVALGTVSQFNKFGAYTTPLIVTGTQYPFLHLLASGVTPNTGIIYDNAQNSGFLTTINNGGDFRFAPLASTDETGVTTAKDGSLGLTVKAGTGYIGIGTTTPTASLTINNNVVKSATIKFTNGGYFEVGNTGDGAPSASDMTGAKLVFYNSGNSASSYAIGEENNAMWFNVINSAAKYKWYNGGNLKMILDGSGNLGIGTSTPASLLNAVSGVSDFRFSTGASALTPTMSVINTGASGKAAALLAGTGGSAFEYDSTGFFDITSNAKSAFTNNTNGSGGTSRLRIDSSGNVGIGTTTPNKKLNVTGTASIGSATGETQFESDGTLLMTGNATVFNDIQYSVSMGKTPQANFPTFATFNTDFSEYSFATNDYIDLGSQELPHNWKEGSPIEFHIHWTTGSGNYVSGDKVQWQLFYSWANMATSSPFTAFSTSASSTVETAFNSTVSPFSHVYSSFGAFTPTGGKIGSQMKLRLKRIAKSAGGTDPGSNPFSLQVGIHYETDTLGSRTTSSK